MIDTLSTYIVIGLALVYLRQLLAVATAMLATITLVVVVVYGGASSVLVQIIDTITNQIKR